MEVKQKYDVMSSDRVQSQENQYEMVPVDTNARRTSVKSTEEVLKQSAWSTPLVVIAGLLCLMVFLLVVILCLSLVLLSASCTSTSTASAGAAVCSYSEWCDDIVDKVNSNVTGSFPDFDEWANDVAQNTFELLQSSPNFTELSEQTTDSAQKLINIVNTLSNLEDTSTSTAGVVDDILLKALELLALHNDSTALPTSCKAIKERQPLSPSGVYLLANTTATYSAYCNMEELCGSGGGWTRLAYLDMSDATQNCPSGFGLYQSGGVRACGRETSNDAGCASVQFPSNGISYSQVCGRVVGYQYASTDAVQHGLWNNPQNYVGGTDPKHNDINSAYVDGVSITRGSPRQHVWTLMAGLAGSAIINDGRYNCPCSSGSLQGPYVQSFVGNDYYCESGAGSSWAHILYTSNPLWDGQNCGSLETACCNAPGIPWFHRNYGSTTTTDYLELRVCADQETADEDVPVGFYEIYVK